MGVGVAGVGVGVSVQCGIDGRWVELRVGDFGVGFGGGVDVCGGRVEAGFGDDGWAVVRVGSVGVGAGTDVGVGFGVDGVSQFR